MGWNEWQEAIEDAVKQRTKARVQETQDERPKKPKKKKHSEMTGWEYMQRLNREGKGFI